MTCAAVVEARHDTSFTSHTPSLQSLIQPPQQQATRDPATNASVGKTPITHTSWGYKPVPSTDAAAQPTGNQPTTQCSDDRVIWMQHNVAHTGRDPQHTQTSLSIPAHTTCLPAKTTCISFVSQHSAAAAASCHTFSPFIS